MTSGRKEEEEEEEEEFMFAPQILACAEDCLASGGGSSLDAAHAPTGQIDREREKERRLRKYKRAGKEI